MEPSVQRCSKILLSVSARINEDLVNDDALAFIELEIQDPKAPIWHEIGKSNTIALQQSMTWTSDFELSFQFQSKQKVKLMLFQYLNNESQVICIGQAELQDLVKSADSQIPAKKLNDSPAGVFHLRYSEEKEDNQKIVFQFAGERLADLDFFDKSDPFFLLYRQVGGEWGLVYRSEVIDNNLFPKWEVVIKKYSEFCGNNPECLMKIECFDFDSETKSEYMGKAIFRAKEVTQNSMFELKNEKKSNETGGFVKVVKSEIIQEKSFLDHLTGGMQINVSLGIDFTASNGMPNMNNSLHHFSENSESEYAQAIRFLGEVLKGYDSDGKIPVFGFGGIPSWLGGLVKHDFSLTEDELNPFVPSFDEVVQVYKNVISKVELRGPTYLRPLINRIMGNFTHDPKTYNILIIITDGDVEDLQETIDVIVEASRKPLSIIIVGVGYESFLKMQKLDDDQKTLVSSNGIKSARDIVQFVRFRSFKHQLSYFAEKALEEIPSQIMKYVNLSQ
jgi:vacuolar-type H+-ATPase subunit F/Vma7